MILLDNKTYSESDFSGCEKLKKKIVDKTLEELEKEGIFIFPDLKDADDLTKEQMILQSKNGNYLTGNVMGFIGCDDERLVISSRFSKDADKDYFLRYMLCRVSMPNIVNLETDADLDSADSMFNLLVFLFPLYLKNAMRKGLFKEYLIKEYNDGNVKGPIDIARHIKMNTPFVGRIAYSRREFSYDNDLMELVRHTIEFIKHKTFGPVLLSEVDEEVKDIVETTPRYSLLDRQKIVSSNIKKPIVHAFYHEYRSLQRLCIMILQHRKHQIGFGQKKIRGILFDGAWLWEEYINTLVSKDFHHPRNKVHDGAQWLFRNAIGISCGKIYPDFIGRNPIDRIIADAKYKPFDNIHSGDYLQLVTYLYRFDSRRGYYFYPESDNNEDDELHLLNGTGFEGNVNKRSPDQDVVLKKLGLKIPQSAESFKDFCNQMTECNEVNFKNKYKSC